jgi:predicted transposase YbfD/YdcC
MDPSQRIKRNKAYPLREVIVITLLAVMAFAGESNKARQKRGQSTYNSFSLQNVSITTLSFIYCFCLLLPFISDWLYTLYTNLSFVLLWEPFSGASSGVLYIITLFGLCRTWHNLIKSPQHSRRFTEYNYRHTNALKDDSPGRCIVTMDAMGCQYNIADQIVAAQADYLFALKENQETLYEDVKTYFEEIDHTHADPNVAVHTTFEVDHGRLERRFHGITSDVSWLIERHPAWKSIKSMGIIDAIRESGDKVSQERRCMYPAFLLILSCLPYRVERIGELENSLQYVVDVVYREDAARIKSGEAPGNWVYFRKIAMTVARADTESKDSIKSRVKQMAWSDEYFERLLFHSSFTSEPSSEALSS